MIKIEDKHNCCGCSACVQSCPKQCISFDEDEQGFRYPFVKKDLCIDCGLCEKVCPCLNQNEERNPLKVFAAINPNEEIRMKSSSGGIFSMIAESVIDEGGVVFGARFDKNWNVIHDYTESKEGLDVFRGSKYVQSNVGQTYIKAFEFLKQGRKVLFSGTSCQIAGLKNFLRKEYENLLTIDVVCHGVPSPKIWSDYITSIASSNEIKAISFKDKITGWRNYSFTINLNNKTVSEKASVNCYMQAFVKNYTLRQSCFKCPSKAGKCHSDITLADYWGIEKIKSDMDDNKGISFICGNTNKGIYILKNLRTNLVETDYNSSISYNPCIKFSTKEPLNEDLFWIHYQKNGILTLKSFDKSKQNIIIKILRKIFA